VAPPTTPRKSVTALVLTTETGDANRPGRLTGTSERDPAKAPRRALGKAR